MFRAHWCRSSRRGSTINEGDSLRWLSRFSYMFGDREAADAYGEQAVSLLDAHHPDPSSLWHTPIGRSSKCLRVG